MDFIKFTLYGHDNKKCETLELDISTETVFVNTQILKVI